MRVNLERGTSCQCRHAFIFEVRQRSETGTPIVCGCRLPLTPDSWVTPSVALLHLLVHLALPSTSGRPVSWMMLLKMSPYYHHRAGDLIHGQHGHGKKGFHRRSSQSYAFCILYCQSWAIQVETELTSVLTAPASQTSPRVATSMTG